MSGDVEGVYANNHDYIHPILCKLRAGYSSRSFRAGIESIFEKKSYQYSGKYRV